MKFLKSLGFWLLLASTMVVMFATGLHFLKKRLAEENILNIPSGEFKLYSVESLRDETRILTAADHWNMYNGHESIWRVNPATTIVVYKGDLECVWRNATFYGDQEFYFRKGMKVRIERLGRRYIRPWIAKEVVQITPIS